MRDETSMTEAAGVGAATHLQDGQVWSCHTAVEKLTVPAGLGRATMADLAELERLFGRDQAGRTPGQLQAAILLEAGVEAELMEVASNLLMYGGASAQWQTLIGNGTATAGQALTYFNNAQAAIGVGDSTTTAVATHTNLQAASNKLRVAMDATYPLHTDGVVSGSASIVYRSSFATGQANYAWQEWGVFNSTTDGTGRMLNRKVESLGTKTSSSTWQLTVTLTLA